MKRSQINQYIQDLFDFATSRQFPLPPWAAYTPAQWATVGAEADEVRRNGLGWDVTDFGSGDFPKVGLTLFTIRNGRPGAAATKIGTDPILRGKDYCEKIMLVRQGQVTPCHFHFAKMEDIINRGGGKLVIRLNNATAGEDLDTQAPVRVQVDGFARTIPAGGDLVLEPGESVTLPQRLYHAFWGLQGAGPVLVGEVSRVNDDARDNRFLQPLPRFPKIEEDAPPRYALCNEYPPAKTS